MSSSDIPVRDEGRDSRGGRGVCIWLTGPSGAGKSTVTNELLSLLDESGRIVSVLDVVHVLRKLPCERTSEGKLLRKAFVAREVARHGGIVICVTVSARRRIREEARRMIGSDRFVEVLIEAPEEVTTARKAARKRKPSLAKRAKRALGPVVARIAFRGHDAYEVPVAPDLRIDTTLRTPAEWAQAIFDLLLERAFVVPPGTGRMDGASEVASAP